MPDWIPTRTTARSSPRSTRPRRTPRARRARSSRSTTTRARRTRRAPRSSSRSGALEGGLGSAFSSGMAATHALITVVAEAGGHIVIPSDLYGGTYRLVDKVLTRWGLEYTMVDQTDLDAVAAAVRDDTRLVWVETPTNPLLNVVDIAGGRGVEASRRSWPSTTRSRRRFTSVRSSSGPTPSSTRRRSTSGVIATPSAARSSSRTRACTSACASSRTPSARCPARWTASSCTAACARCTCACAPTPRTARP